MAKTLIKQVAIGSNSDYYLRLYYEETNVDMVNNRSDVKISLYGYTTRTAYWSWNGYGNNSFTVVVDGTTSTLSNQNVDTETWQTEHYLHSYSKTISHNADGSKSITVSGSMTYQGGGTSLVAGTYSTGNVTQNLTTIARASTVGAVSNTTITSSSGNVTINISKKNSAYYDQIVTTGAISKTINIGTASSGTISWSNLLAAMPSTDSATLNITVKTYSNSGYSTLIGSNTGKATITINKNNVKPSISFGAISVNASGLSGKLVAGVSTAKATWTVTNATGASVSKVVVTGSNCSVASGASSTSTSGTPVTAQLPSRTSDYTITLTATVTDSRGATASATTSGATVYGYAPPNLTFNAYRVASSSATAADPTGEYVYTTFSASVGASVGGSNTVSISSKTPNSITNGGHYALATNATQAFTVVAKDTVGNTTSKTINIGTALIPFDLYSNAAGTSVGVGFGRMAEAGTVKSSMPIYTDSSLFTGGKTAWNSTSHGVYIGGDGTIHLAHDNEPYIGFHYGNQQTASGAITAKSGGVLDITGGSIRVNGSEISTAANTVKTSGNQTISGIKTITGQIRKSTAGGKWVNGRDSAPLRNTNAPGTNTFVPLISFKSDSGTYDFGTLGNSLYIVYASDADYNADNNNAHHLRIGPSGEIDPGASIAVSYGGTGATSAASARSNLGVNQPTLSSSLQINGNSTVTFNVTTANYNFYLFKFAMNGVYTTIFTVRDLLDTTPKTYWVNDGTSSGAGMIITRTASTITVKRDGSTSCWCRLAYWN